MDARQPDHQHGDHGDDAECLQRNAPVGMCDNVNCCRQGAFALRGIGAERGGNLLQKDDDGDTECEPLDHRPRDERDSPSETYDSRDQHDDPGHHRDQRDRRDTVRRNDGREDHGHRTRRAGDLYVRPAEDRGDEARDDSGDQTRGCPDTRTDAEGQCQREGDDAYGDTCDEV